MSPRDTHDGFPELVAGHALHALEPEDEVALLRHLGACDRCTRELAAARDVLGQLAYAAEPVEPPASLFAKIRTEIERSDPDAFRDPVPTPVPAPVTDLEAVRQHRRLRVPDGPARWLVGAAAAVVLVLGALVGWNVTLLNGRQDSDQRADALQAAVRMIEATPGRTVPLTGEDGLRAVAVVHGSTVSLVTDGLAENDSATTTYVLWGQTGAGAPVGLTAFDVTSDGVNVVRDAGFPATVLPERLMVTHESGRSVPVTPQNPVLMSGRSA
jgi:hypothetical protein